MIGIGIIGYHCPKETIRLLSAIHSSTPQPFHIVVRDNTDVPDRPLARMAAQVLPPETVEVISPGKNVGCARARNEIVARLTGAWPAMKYVAMFDQDVVVRPGWLEDMLAVAEERPDAATVTWPCFNMGCQVPTKEGKIVECAGGACLHRVEAIRDIGGWDEGFFFYRFDTWFCLLGSKQGWGTYLVTKYLTPKDIDAWRSGQPVSDDSVRVAHVHPHRGTRRNPDFARIRRESNERFRRLLREHRLEHITPTHLRGVPAALYV